MDGRRSVKRVRADSAGNFLFPNGNGPPINSSDSSSQLPSVDIATLHALLDKLPASWKHGALLQAAFDHPDVLQTVIKGVETVNERRSKRVISFDHLYQSVWDRLQARGHHKTAVLRAASDARNSIDDTIEIIAEQCRRPSSRETRRNGFEALVKIGKAILTSERNTLGVEVRRLLGDDDTLEDGILGILKQMDPSEKTDLRRPSGDLWRRFVRLRSYTARYWGGDTLNRAFNYLETGNEEEEEEGEEEEEEDEDEEDEDEEDEEGEGEEGEEEEEE
jgi:hypothetical protein